MLLKNKKISKTKILCLCAMFAAISAAISPIAVPIGPVPINFVHTSIFIAAGLLGAKYGAVSQLVFVMLGAAGLPVFGGGTGGVGHLLSPVGGFIISYIFAAFTAGFIMQKFGYSVKVMVAAMYAGYLVTYIMGNLWFVHVTGSGLLAALAVTTLPFLPGDVVKVVAAVLVIRRLRLRGILFDISQ